MSLPRSDTLIAPLADVEIAPAIAALPKADIHVHAEAGARLEQVIAQRTGGRRTDWRAKARELMRNLPPGMARLETWEPRPAVSPLLGRRSGA